MSGAFMSVTDLAARRGVSKQAISKSLARFGDQVPTRKLGSRLLIDVEAFDRVSGSETDPAQALRNRGRDDEAPPATPAAPAKPSAQAVATTAFSVNRARRESFEAELARLELEKVLGKVVPVEDVTDAMVNCSQKLVRIIEQMPSRSEDPAVRKILKEVSHDLRVALYESMKLTASEGDLEDGEDDA